VPGSASRPTVPSTDAVCYDRLTSIPVVELHGLRPRFRIKCRSPFSSELRETALAHTIGNKAEAANRRGDALEKRRAMMEAWAQWCEPKAANVLAFARPGAEG